MISTDNNRMLVSQILPGGPAANSNQIRTGDALIDVDGHDVVGRSEQQVYSMLRGERNSPITMIFRRGGGGGEQIVVTLLRAVAGGGKAPGGVAAPVKISGAAPSWHAAPDDQALLESMTGLKSEFSNLSFLWGEPVTDAVEENMRDWKLNMLYGPKMDIPSEPVPLPAALMQEAPSMNESHLGMRRSLNSGNIPMYRSFDQGTVPSFARAGQPMRMSGMSMSGMSSPPRSIDNMAVYDMPLYDMQRFQGAPAMDGNSFRGGSAMDANSFRVMGGQTTGHAAMTSFPYSATMGSSGMSRPLTSMPVSAALASRPAHMGAMGAMMQAADKNEMVC